MNERLTQTLESASRIDRRMHIVGSFLLETSPVIRSFAPDPIQDACVGLEVPVRWPDLLQYDFVSVEHDDLIASLLIQDREQLADWFDTTTAHKRRLHRPINWAFNASAGKAALDSAVSTASYYSYLQSKNRH